MHTLQYNYNNVLTT